MVHTDCRLYRLSEPCRPHKQAGISCDGCTFYAPVRERIAIVKLGAMGDVLRTTSCLPPLKRRHPHGHVTWVTRSNSAELLKDNPDVDRVLSIEENYLELLLSEQFDLAFSPDADSLSASIVRLINAGTKRGFVGDGRGGATAQNAAAESWWLMGLDDGLKRRNRRTYGQWLYDMCEVDGPISPPHFEPSSDARDRIDHLLRGVAEGAGQIVCLNTGTSGRWAEKRWKARAYADFAELVLASRRDVAVLLVGGAAEAEFNREVLGLNPRLRDGGTGHSVGEFAALIEASDWILTPDSLAYHIACAVGTPAVCVVGPTAPWELDRYGLNLVVQADVTCVACYLPRCPHASTCMDALTAATVWEQVCPWLEEMATPADAVATSCGRGRYQRASDWGPIAARRAVNP
jgi:lipopolysaccharide heptosyltransferase III